VVRKELAGLAPGTPAKAALGKALYSRESTDRTDSECLRRCEQLLFEGRRVIVDATLIEEARRRPSFELALGNGVPALLLVCEADEATVKARLAARHGDASDADWSAYVQAAGQWDAPRANELRLPRTIAAGDTAEAALDNAESALRDFGLIEDERAHRATAEGPSNGMRHPNPDIENR
jgi:predicted kinase